MKLEALLMTRNKQLTYLPGLYFGDHADANLNGKLLNEDVLPKLC